MLNLDNTFVISDARLYDGIGDEPTVSDVAVKHGIIAAVAPAGELNFTGIQRIEAGKLALAPGFIDVHGHTDETIFNSPDCGSALTQGVTTEITGNCGISQYIATEGSSEPGTPPCPVKKYAELIEKLRPAINIATLVGHGSLRRKIMGFAERRPTASEMSGMKQILSEGLEQGAVGFSSGLWYIPGSFAGTQELIELATLLRGTGKPYATHMRSEGDRLVESVEEAIRIATAGAGNLQLSHLKTFYRQHWGKIVELLEIIRRHRDAGMNINADRYPFVWNGTSMRMLVPPPYDRMDNNSLRKMLSESSEERAKLEWALKAQGAVCGPLEGVILTNSEHPSWNICRGMNLVEIGHMFGISAEAAAVRILSEDNPTAAFHTMCAENLHRILGQDYVFAGSDSSASNVSNPNQHPRAYGTFPRFFRMVTEQCSAAAAIRRMTYLPALKFNLKRRGAILPGFAADMALFDEKCFDSTADFTTPNRTASGVRMVLVNGNLACENGELAPCRSGKFLRT